MRALASICVTSVLALTLAACGSSSSTPRGTLPAIQVARTRIAVSTVPALRAVDTSCATVVPPLRPTILSAYALDPQSLTPAALRARAALYAASARRLHALALGIPRDQPVLRKLRPIVRTFADAERVLGRSLGRFAVVGSGANGLGAQVAIESDVATLTGFADANGLPSCAPSGS